MDDKWENFVRPNLPELVKVLNPTEIGDGLFARKLVSEDQYHTLHDSSIPLRKRSRSLLVDILPKKGKKAFDDFVTVLEETEGQKHIVKDVLNLHSNGEKEAITQKIAVEVSDEVMKLRDDLSKKVRELAELKRELSSERVTSAALRNETGNPDENDLNWSMTKKMPVKECLPFGRVTELNGKIYVAYKNKMYWFNKEWEETNVALDILIAFECDGKLCLIDKKCKKIYEWEDEKDDMKLIHKIPKKYHMEGRSAIGDRGKIYFVGGGRRSNHVDCFDISKGKWKVIKNMKEGRCDCSLAVINDKLFVGGGEKNVVESYCMKEDKWIDIQQTTNKLCQFSSLNEKLIATGGGHLPSDVVELYDSRSGKWLRMPSMNQGRSSHGACTTNDSKLFVVGGYGANNTVEFLET